MIMQLPPTYNNFPYRFCIVLEKVPEQTNVRDAFMSAKAWWIEQFGPPQSGANFKKWFTTNLEFHCQDDSMAAQFLLTWAHQ